MKPKIWKLKIFNDDCSDIISVFETIHHYLIWLWVKSHVTRHAKMAMSDLQKYPINLYLVQNKKITMFLFGKTAYFHFQFFCLSDLCISCL